MRFLHLSDLHLGKRVCEFSMLDDQRYILEQVLSLLDARPVDGVLLAGDLYDKPVPPAEAVRLLDWFLTELAARGLPVFAVSGNHDSADRIAFGARLLAGSRVYVSPVFAAPPAPITLTDEYGPVDIWLLPFLKPAAVRHVFPDEKIESYNDAIGCVLNACTPDPARRNVLVAHQFVAGAAVCESEEPSVGGVDSIDVPLRGLRLCSSGPPPQSPEGGAGHRPVRRQSPQIFLLRGPSAQSRPLRHPGRKGQRPLRGRASPPARPAGAAGQLHGAHRPPGLRRHADGRLPPHHPHRRAGRPDALARLRVIYPNLMRLDYDNRRTRAAETPDAAARAESKTPLEHFAAFYEAQNGQPLSDEQAAFCQSLIEDIWKEDEA